MTGTMTNVHGLPAAVVAALQNDDYDRGRSDITVTELIAPPRMVALKERHAHEIVEDASDMLFLLQGKLMHKLLETAGVDALTEERLYTERLGWVIGGQFDNVTVQDAGADTYKVTDWKYSTVWAWKEGAKPEYIAQLNLHALLLREHGFNVTTLTNGVLYRDWSKLAAQRGEHPQVGAAEFDVPLWTPAQAEAYLVERVRLHQDARRELPECNEEDRWERPGLVAVMKYGVAKAKRLLGSESEALRWAAENEVAEVVDGRSVLKKGFYLEQRPSEAVRCRAYCAASKWCSQWQIRVLEQG